MKYFFTYLLLLLIIIPMASAQAPSVVSQNNDVKISKIETTDRYIIIHLSVPSSNNKRTTFRISSGTMLLPKTNGTNDFLNEVLKDYELELEDFILDNTDLKEMMIRLLDNENNPYLTADLKRASKKILSECTRFRKQMSNLGLMIIGAGKEKLDTEYKIYSKEPTNWHFTMYFDKNALPIGCSDFHIIEFRKKNMFSRYWNSVHFEMPCPDHPNTYIASEEDLKKQISNNNDGIVGIYENVVNGKYRISVVKQNNYYNIVYLTGIENACWKMGDVKAVLRPSATNGIYKGTWYMTNFNPNENCIVTFDGVKMNVSIDGEVLSFLKMYPTSSVGSVSSGEVYGTGSGFAIGNGYIVTNNHVIEGANKINIKGVNGDLNTGYSAQVVVVDKNNDIAILKINDSRFADFGSISYSVSARMVDVGDDVFVLGYPLTQALGNEIKLTNGIVSSRTGYQNDVSTYQISAPVQPGNSGGPLFDSKGNVVGIVNAGVPGAENVGYAIKISYLKNLIESAGLNIKLPGNNTISTLSLSEKVKRVKKFVYYIECSK